MEKPSKIITLERLDDQGRYTGLVDLRPESPGEWPIPSLQLAGQLRHGQAIRPRTDKDAAALRDWLEQNFDI